MVSEWRTSTWGEEISLEYGKALREYENVGGQYRVYGSNGPIGWTSEPLVDGPGVILGRKGAYRGVEFSRAPFFVIDTAYYVAPKREFDLRWLYYAIKHHKLGEIDDGSPIPSTTRAAVYVKEFQVPPLSEQRAIASILGALDDKIELNRRMNETLEAIAQALFREWFVNAAKEGLPEGWREDSIFEVAKLLSGGTPKTDREDYWNGSIQWASAKDVSQCGETFLICTERTITDKGLNESATQIIPKFSSVVVARGATTGRMVMFGDEIAMNQTCYALTTLTGTPFSLYCLLRNEMESLVHKAHGSVFDTITTSTFATSRISLPPCEVLNEFETTVNPLFLRILANSQESSTLAQTRDALLPKLLSGEIDIVDARMSQL